MNIYLKIIILRALSFKVYFLIYGVLGSLGNVSASLIQIQLPKSCR